MDPDHASTGDSEPPARHSLGRAISAVPDAGPPRPTADRPSGDRPDEGVPGAWFTVVLRGYDRAQVDARLAELDRRIRDEIVRADAAEAELTTARTHVRRLQEAGTPSSGEDRGFGVRVERVLQAAEREAAELRSKASEEASALVDRARADADRARRQTEEALLGRAAKLDDEFTARSAALDAREQEVDRIVERARQEADRIRLDAERAAGEESAAAERRASELLRQAERTIEQQRADATRDIGRMAALRDEVRQELSRMYGMLREELGDGAAVTDVAPPRTAEIALVDEPWSPERTDDDVSTAIGTIPPYTVASVGVLPFGDRSAGGPANGRSFAFELVPGMRTDREPDRTDGVDGARTSDDTANRDDDGGSDPTRSTTPTRGRR